MSMWTIAFGIFLGRLMYNTVAELVNAIVRKIERNLDEKNPHWKDKYDRSNKPREPIGFKQTTIES